MPTFKDKEILLIRPNWVSGIRAEYKMPTTILSGIGLDDLDTVQLEATYKFSAEYLFSTRADLWSLVNFFDARLGRTESFWSPTWTRDVVITDGFLDTDATLVISDIDYQQTWRNFPITGRFLYIEWPDQSYVIVSIQEDAAGTLTLAGPIGKACALADVGGLFACFLFLVRFEQDEIEIKYYTDTVASCEITFATDGVTGYIDESITVTSTSTTTSTTSTSFSTSSTTHSSTTSTNTTVSSTSSSTVTTGCSTTSTLSSTSTTTTGVPETWYVSPSGDDYTGDGSSSNPWKRIYRAMSAAGAGDTIICKSGVYSNELAVLRKMSVRIESETGNFLDVIVDGWSGEYLWRLDGIGLTMDVRNITFRFKPTVATYALSTAYATTRDSRIRVIGCYFDQRVTNYSTYGVYSYSGIGKMYTDVYNCTFVGFKNSYGYRGVYLYGLTGSSAVVRNSIFKGLATGLQKNSSTSLDETYNGFYWNTTDISGDTKDGTDLTTDPELTGEGKLVTGSPYIDAGTSTPYTADPNPNIGCFQGTPSATTTSSTTTTSTTSTTSTSTSTSSSSSTTTSSSSSTSTSSSTTTTVAP